MLRLIIHAVAEIIFWINTIEETPRIALYADLNGSFHLGRFPHDVSLLLAIVPFILHPIFLMVVVEMSMKKHDSINGQR
jgi:hypothetical protein